MIFSRQIAASFLSIAMVLSVAPSAMSAEFNGIKHSIEVSIISDPKLIIGAGAPFRATLTLLIRVSAHSKMADFSGEIPVSFESFSPNDGVPFRNIWSQDNCHERRGLPKIWIEHLSGSVMQGETKTIVDAVPRHIGAVLPDDELKTQQQVEIANEITQSVRVLEARSLKSHFLIQLRLISIACQI
jgi:hypothetical protein